MADPSFTSLRLGQSRRLYVSQTTGATWGAAAALTHLQLHSCDFAPLVPKPIVINDANYSSGNVSSSPRSNKIIGYTMASNPTVWLEHHAMGIIMSAALGNSAVGSVVGTCYPHSMYLQDRPYFLPGRTFGELRNPITSPGYDTAVDTLVHGCSITDVTIAWQESGFATMSYNILGIGAPSGAPTVVSETGNLAGQATLLTSDKIRVYMQAATSAGVSSWDGTTGAIGTITAGTGGWGTTEAVGFANISHLIPKGSVRITTGAGDARAGGMGISAGNYMGPPIAMEPRAYLDLTWRMDNTLDEWARAYADQTSSAWKEYTFVIDFAGTVDNEYTRMVFPVCVHVDNPGGGTGVGMVTHDSSFECRKPSDGTQHPFYMLSQIATGNVDLVSQA